MGGLGREPALHVGADLGGRDVMGPPVAERGPEMSQAVAQTLKGAALVGGVLRHEIIEERAHRDPVRARQDCRARRAGPLAQIEEPPGVPNAIRPAALAEHATAGEIDLHPDGRAPPVQARRERLRGRGGASLWFVHSVLSSLALLR
jgi:hypothetical protein